MREARAVAARVGPRVNKLSPTLRQFQQLGEVIRARRQVAGNDSVIVRIPIRAGRAVVQTSTAWRNGDETRSRPAGAAATARAPGMPLEARPLFEIGQLLISALRVGVPRVGEHLAHAADLDDAAGVHDRHLVDELRHQAHVVADQDHRGTDRFLHAARSSPSPGAA